MTARLVLDFKPDLPAGAVLRCVARCRAALARRGVRAGLVDAVEVAARSRLQSRTLESAGRPRTDRDEGAQPVVIDGLRGLSDRARNVD